MKVNLYLSNQLWKRWLREYVPELQRRSKWCSKQKNIQVGDVVLLCEENTPRFLWPFGLVIEMKEGRDKLWPSHTAPAWPGRPVGGKLVHIIKGMGGLGGCLL